MAKFKPETMGGAFGLGVATTLVAALGLYLFNHGEPNDYNKKLIGAADRTAVGQPFPRSEFTVVPGGPASKDAARFAINAMLANAGEPPLTGEKHAQQPNARVRAAATCGLLVLNGGKESDPDKNAWGAGQNAANVDGSRSEQIASTFNQAADGCLATFDTAIDKGTIKTLVVPIALAP